MSLTITDAGALTTIQDAGRPGWAHLGVPRAGALDRPAAALANRLVGNVVDAAVLESTLTGLSFEAARTLTIAVTGAPCSVRVGSRAVAFAESFTVREGEEVRVGRAVTGLRSYVAVAGGIVVEPVLGSRSTDTLAWVGPPRVTLGDVLPVGPAAGRPQTADTAQPARHGDVVLRVAPGPRVGWFRSPEELCERVYEVGVDSNRVGLRLDGPALTRERDEELASEGMVLGAVQVPPSGTPVVFLNDHPTTGGYPVIAVVVPQDLHRCAQLGPGDRVRFSAVSRRPA